MMINETGPLPDVLLFQALYGCRIGEDFLVSMGLLYFRARGFLGSGIKPKKHKIDFFVRVGPRRWVASRFEVPRCEMLFHGSILANGLEIL